MTDSSTSSGTPPKTPPVPLPDNGLTQAEFTSLSERVFQHPSLEQVSAVAEDSETGSYVALEVITPLAARYFIWDYSQDDWVPAIVLEKDSTTGELDNLMYATPESLPAEESPLSAGGFTATDLQAHIRMYLYQIAEKDQITFLSDPTSTLVE